MRLVDADELKKVGLFNGKWDRENGNEHFMYGIECVVDFVNNLPTIEAEPVTRCKDCYECTDVRGTPYCTFWDRNTEDDWYCCHGWHCGARMDGE